MPAPLNTVAFSQLSVPHATRQTVTFLLSSAVVAGGVGFVERRMDLTMAVLLPL